MCNSLPSHPIVDLPNAFPAAPGFPAFRAVALGANLYDLTRDYGFDGPEGVRFDRWCEPHLVKLNGMTTAKTRLQYVESILPDLATFRDWEAA